jgi:CRISPR-associated protein (TIGR03986 family)
MSNYPKQKDNIYQSDDPKHNREAIAPYNFVELPDRVVKAKDATPAEMVRTQKKGTEETHPCLVRHDCAFTERYSGYITGTLIADSPIYTRTGLSPEEFALLATKPFHEMEDDQKERYAQFFALNGVPAIPGSSLRGMLRSLVEIAAYGKMTRVSKQMLIYRAIGDKTSLGTTYREAFLDEEPEQERYFRPIVKAGFMHKTAHGWQIKPARTLGTGEWNYTYSRIEFKKPNRVPKNLQRWRNHLSNALTIWVSVDPPTWHKHAALTPKPVHLWYAAVNQAVMSEPETLSSQFHEGVLVKSGRMNNKHMHFVFNLPVEDQTLFLDVSREIEVAYREQFTDGQKGVLGSDEGIFQQDQPVFYLVKNDKLLFLGHAQNFRLPYPHSPRDFVPLDLRDPAITNTDLVEAMFGYVPETGNNTEPRDRTEPKDERQAYAGRLFFDDALLDMSKNNQTLSNNPYITPRILAGPKPTTFQHYLVQEQDDRRNLTHYASQPESETVIRGHKLYWHQGSNPERTNTEWLDHIKEQDEQRIKQAPKQYTGMQPLAPGASFNVTIRFDNLSDVELGALLWIMQLAGDSQYRLKLGMGKPLGMGSVRLEDTRVVRIKHQQRYEKLFAAQGDWETGEKEIAEQEQQQCITAFQQYVLHHSGVQAPSFDDLPRISMLKQMLSWPGPSEKKTRYMEIERDKHDGYVSGKPRQDGKVNEYANRPVLPGPWQVLGKPAPERYALSDPEQAQPEQQPEHTATLAEPAQVQQQEQAAQPGVLSEPEQMQEEPKQLGIIEALATPGKAGQIKDKEDNKYFYIDEFVVAGVQLETHQRIWFRADERKVPTGKKRKQSRRPCAVDIEPYVE